MSQLADKPEKPRPCALCSAPSEVDCWDFVLCHVCHGLWHRDVECPPDNARWDPNHNVSQAAWRKVTRSWLQKAKAVRAA